MISGSRLILEFNSLMASSTIFSNSFAWIRDPFDLVLKYKDCILRISSTSFTNKMYSIIFSVLFNGAAGREPGKYRPRLVTKPSQENSKLARLPDINKCVFVSSSGSCTVPPGETNIPSDYFSARSSGCAP